MFFRSPHLGSISDYEEVFRQAQKIFDLERGELRLPIFRTRFAFNETWPSFICTSVEELMMTARVMGIAIRNAIAAKPDAVALAENWPLTMLKRPDADGVKISVRQAPVDRATLTRLEESEAWAVEQDKKKWRD